MRLFFSLFFHFHFETILIPVGCLALSREYIHVMTIIFKHSLKPLNDSKLNFLCGDSLISRDMTASI